MSAQVCDLAQNICLESCLMVQNASFSWDASYESYLRPFPASLSSIPISDCAERRKKAELRKCQHSLIRLLANAAHNFPQKQERPWSSELRHVQATKWENTITRSQITVMCAVYFPLHKSEVRSHCYRFVVDLSQRVCMLTDLKQAHAYTL